MFILSVNNTDYRFTFKHVIKNPRNPKKVRHIVQCTMTNLTTGDREQALAKCNSESGDKFNKDTGRRIALGRVISRFNKDDRARIVSAYNARIKADRERVVKQVILDKAKEIKRQERAGKNVKQAPLTLRIDLTQTPS